MKKKTVALLFAGAMIFGVAAGGTMAWLTASTGEVKNTFTVGNIDIDLKEHQYDADTGELLEGENNEVTENEYHFVPGSTFPKDPFVSVDEKSEDCYLFVKAEELFNSCTVNKGTPDEKTVDSIIIWDAEPHVHDEDGADMKADGWYPYDPSNSEGIEYWYRIVKKDDETREWYLLKDDKVTVNTGVLKEMVSEINRVDDTTGKNKPQLVFHAAAIQKDYLTVEAAWKQLPESFRGSYDAPPEISSGN